MLPGKPYSPLNAGVAPSCDRMKSSAIGVEIAGRHAGLDRVAQRVDRRGENLSTLRHQIDLARGLQLDHRRPRLFSIRRRRRAERGDRRAVTSPTVADRVDDDDLAAVRAIPVENGRRLLVIDAKARADRVGLVVLAAHELCRRTCHTTLPSVAPGVRRLTVLAHHARRSAGARSRRCRCRRRRRRRRAGPRPSSIASSPSACGTVRTTPSRITPFAYSALRSSSPTMPRMTESGTSSPRSMHPFASRPSGVPARTAARRTSPVANVGTPQIAGEQRRLRSLARARLTEQNDDHGAGEKRE